MEFWFLQWLYHAGVSVSVQAEETTETEEAAETDSSAESEDDLRILFDQAVEDAMIDEDGEILPVVIPVSYTHLTKNTSRDITSEQ